MKRIRGVFVAVVAVLAPSCGGGGGGGGKFVIPPPAAWVTQQRIPTSSNLRSVIFSNTNLGIVTGQDGTIFRTDDAGATWLQEEFTPHNLTGDLNWNAGLNTTLVAVGKDKTTGNGRYWITTNAISWSTPLAAATGAPYTDVALSATSGGPAPVVLYLLHQDGTLDVVTPTGPAPSVSTGTWTNANGLFYIGFQGAGYVCGDHAGAAQINRTKDGGAHWTSATLPANTGTIRRINVTPDLIAHACGDDTSGHGLVLVADSVNPDQWDLLPGIPASLPSLQALSFPINENLGWVVGNAGTIYQISTSGAVTTWTQQAAGLTSVNLYGVYFIDNAHGFAVGDQGTILKTVDGSHWAIISRGDAGINFNAASFVDDGSKGIAVGNDGAGNAKIYRTMDSGTTWTPMTTGIGTQTLYGACVPRAGAGTFAYVCGSGGVALRNPDVWGTGSWTQVTGTTSTDTYRAILFPQNELVGVLVGNSTGNTPVMLSTSNGTTWAAPTTLAPTLPTNSYNALSANLGGTRIYACGSPNGSSAVISVSTDLANGWKTWTDLAPTLSGALTLPAISSPEGTFYTAFAAASDGNVYRLTPGAPGSWGAAAVGWGAAHPTSLGFQGDLDGLVATDAGGLFYTIDAGSHWTASTPHTKDAPRAIWVSPTATGLGYIVCGDGTIMRTVTLGQ